MLKLAGHCWRVIATGLGFLLFGTGGLLMRALVFPAINLIIREQAPQTTAARHVIRFSFRAFVRLMRALGVLRYEINGLEKLERTGLLILANHPTLIDTVFLMAFVKRADCIVKSSLWNNPFTHGPVRAAGYIKNENGPELINRCIASLKAGNNLLIFPEGTRTPHDGQIKFKRGAANVAVRGMYSVTPVMIQCTPATLGKGEKWWKVPPRGMHFTIDVQEDIDIQPFISAADSETMAVRRLTDYLQSYFSRGKKHHAAA